ncbi:MAG: serine/threonine protein kinase [Candidatus Obscuribacterales bacterium]|nr:serine/threonine protein kinase [Candidatus Obscuribacterales bacterium]
MDGDYTQHNTAPSLIKEEYLSGKLILDQYRVGELLGVGGMAVVYKAESLKHGGMVAIKTLNCRDSEIEARFAHEVKVHSRLDHKNIVRALDCLIDEASGRTYFVMELFEGEVLKDILRRQGNLGNHELIYRILFQIAEAVDYAHRKEIIHRDIKPANIIVFQKDGEVLVKIVDFGIAKVIEDMQRLTREGTVVGSALYMSPEQCMGKKVDRRSDIYSLCCVAFEIATGIQPYLDGNLNTVMSRHCDPLMIPPSVTTVVPDYPGAAGFDALVEKGMATDADERFQSIGEFRRALEFWYRSILPAPRLWPVVESPVVESPAVESAGDSPQAHLAEPVARELRESEKDNLLDLVGKQRAAQIDAFYKSSQVDQKSKGVSMLAADVNLKMILVIVALLGLILIVSSLVEQGLSGKPPEPATGLGADSGTDIGAGSGADSGADSGSGIGAGSGSGSGSGIGSSSSLWPEKPAPEPTPAVSSYTETETKLPLAVGEDGIDTGNSKPVRILAPGVYR